MDKQSIEKLKRDLLLRSVFHKKVPLSAKI